MDANIIIEFVEKRILTETKNKRKKKQIILCLKFLQKGQKIVMSVDNMRYNDDDLVMILNEESFQNTNVRKTNKKSFWSLIKYYLLRNIKLDIIQNFWIIRAEPLKLF